MHGGVASYSYGEGAEIHMIMGENITENIYLDHRLSISQDGDYEQLTSLRQA
jgi:hypothetical protein